MVLLFSVIVLSQIFMFLKMGAWCIQTINWAMVGLPLSSWDYKFPVYQPLLLFLWSTLKCEKQSTWEDASDLNNFLFKSFSLLILEQCDGCRSFWVIQAGEDTNQLGWLQSNSWCCTGTLQYPLKVSPTGCCCHQHLELLWSCDRFSWILVAGSCHSILSLGIQGPHLSALGGCLQLRTL